MKSHRLVSIALATVAALALSAGSASAKNLFSLDSDPTSPGKVVQDASGNAYVAWVHAGHTNPDSARFCKIPHGGTCTSPISLPIPGATSVVDGVTGAFPILGPGSTVYVIAPRYVDDDVIKYTSTNGGVSFDGGVAINAGHNTAAGAYSNKTNPTDVILSGSQFLIGADNAGLGFSGFGLTQGNFEFTSPGPGGVASSSMALDGRTTR